MQARVSFTGGNTDERLSGGKVLSLNRALERSYQAEWITYKGNKVRCLINQDTLKEDCDQKKIAVKFDANFQSGDVFYWDRTDSYWISFLQDLSEEAYYCGSVRKCNYSIDVSGTEYWVALKGPSASGIDWKTKSAVAYNTLNYDMEFFITKNDETKEYFKRFKKIKIDGHNWEVIAADAYSQEHVIEVTLKEYFDNDMEDAEIAIEPVVPDTLLPYIDGLQFVEPYQNSIAYTIENLDGGEFVISSTKVEIVNADANTCEINILTGKSGSFDIIYRTIDSDTTLTVNIESF